MNKKLVAAVESKDDKFQEATVGVNAEPELRCWIVDTVTSEWEKRVLISGPNGPLHRERKHLPHECKAKLL